MIYPSKPIGDLVEKVSTWNPRNETGAESFKYIDLSSVDKKKKIIDSELVPIVEPQEAPSRARQLVECNDVLVATVRPNLNGVALVESHEYSGATASTGYCVLRPNTKKLDSKYLYYWVTTENFVNEMIRLSTGANYPAVSDKIIKNSKIPLPSLKEQKRIAAILDKADAIRRKRQQVIDLTDQLLRSVFLDMFGDPDDSWETVPFLDVAKTEKNSFVNGPFGSNLLTSELQDTGVPVLYIQDVRNGRFQKKSNRHVTENKAEQLSSCNVFSGDVLVAKVGDPPGAAAVYPSEEPDAIVTQDVVRIRPNLDKTTPEFIAEYFNSSVGKKWLAPIIVEATRSRFGLGEIKKRIFMLPPLELQKQYSEIHKMIVSDRKKLMEGVERVDNLFNSLALQAFNGELINQTKAA